MAEEVAAHPWVARAAERVRFGTESALQHDWGATKAGLDPNGGTDVADLLRQQAYWMAAGEVAAAKDHPGQDYDRG